MLEVQLQIMSLWQRAAAAARHRLDQARDDERGEITATTALIVILVVAAIAAGAVIAAKIAANAEKVPTP